MAKAPKSTASPTAGKPSYLEKVATIAALQNARNVAENAEVALRLNNRKDDADDVWERTTRLRSEIDILIGQLMDAWVAQAVPQTVVLTDIKGQLDTSVVKIKAQQDTANQVVKILGLLDDVLKIAAKLLA